MALARAVQNSIHSGQEVTWTREDRTPQDLTGATLSGVIRHKESGEARAITGVLTPVSGSEAAGIFTWAYSAQDVSTVGAHDVQFKATYSDDKPDISFSGPWLVEEDLTT